MDWWSEHNWLLKEGIFLEKATFSSANILLFSCAVCTSNCTDWSCNHTPMNTLTLDSTCASARHKFTLTRFAECNLRAATGKNVANYCYLHSHFKRCLFDTVQRIECVNSGKEYPVLTLHISYDISSLEALKFHPLWTWTKWESPKATSIERDWKTLNNFSWNVFKTCNNTTINLASLMINL